MCRGHIPFASFKWYPLIRMCMAPPTRSELSVLVEQRMYDAEQTLGEFLLGLVAFVALFLSVVLLLLLLV